MSSALQLSISSKMTSLLSSSTVDDAEEPLEPLSPTLATKAKAIHTEPKIRAVLEDEALQPFVQTTSDKNHLRYESFKETLVQSEAMRALLTDGELVKRLASVYLQLHPVDTIPHT